MGNVYPYSKKAAYVIRFDDLCPEMNTPIWEKIESILNRYHVRPIVAVVPCNEDPDLKRQEAIRDFWDRIRKYQKCGWMICLHGYDHVYTNHNSGIMGISANSEFAGIDYALQIDKITRGFDVFAQHGVRVDGFIAPSHSFDSTTLKVLKKCGINLISDGHLNYPYSYQGMRWIPCQVWDRIRDEKRGLHTICIHHNNWTNENVYAFEKDMARFHEAIISPFLVSDFPKLRIAGIFKSRLISDIFRTKRRIKRLAGRKK